MGGRRLIDETGMAPVNKEIIDMLTRMIVVLVLAVAGCEVADGVVMQDVAGPGGVTVTAPAAGQLQVSWTGDPAAFKYNVFQSAAGGVFSLVGIVLNPSAQPPAPTSYVAVNLSGGVSYCYKIQAVYPDQSMSDLGAQGCGVATGSGGGGAMLTKVISPNPTGIPSFATIDVVNLGTGNHTANLDQYLTVGDHLHAIRLYVQDNTLPGPCVACSGPTELISRLKVYSPATGSVPTTLATSAASNGSGTVQVLSLTGLDVAIAGGGITHSLQTIDYQGVAQTVAWSIEVDYITAP